MVGTTVGGVSELPFSQEKQSPVELKGFLATSYKPMYSYVAIVLTAVQGVYKLRVTTKIIVNNGGHFSYVLSYTVRP